MSSLFIGINIEKIEPSEYLDFTVKLISNFLHNTLHIDNPKPLPKEFLSLLRCFPSSISWYSLNKVFLFFSFILIPVSFTDIFKKFLSFKIFVLAFIVIFPDFVNLTEFEMKFKSICFILISSDSIFKNSIILSLLIL
jgi:hypothetical protein